MCSLLRATEKEIKCPHAINRKIACSLKLHSFINEKFLRLEREAVLQRITPNHLDFPILQYYSHQPSLPVHTIFSFEEEVCLQKRSCNKIMPHLKLTIHSSERELTSAEKEPISLLFILI